jgi:hypothetical protein
MAKNNPNPAEKSSSFIALGAPFPPSKGQDIIKNSLDILRI